jgi:beta-glucanase (GH16 family)
MTINPNNLAGTATETFDEEFNNFNLWNGTTGWDTRPGWAQWPQYNSGFTLSGNGEQEWYIQPNYAPTASANPFSDQNGVLTISANPTNPAISQYVQNQPYTSGMIDTYHEFSQTYGYFEMRAKMPAGQGLWPAFWLLPENNNWPPELDVMEMLGQYKWTVVNTVHSQVSGTKQLGTNHYTTSQATNVANMTTGFHTFGVDWEPNTITWYVDGQKTFQTATPADMNQPMYMLANLAVGGYWPGSPNSTTPFPAQMQIDYIRAYEPSAAPAAIKAAAMHTSSTSAKIGMTSSSTSPTSHATHASGPHATSLAAPSANTAPPSASLASGAAGANGATAHLDTGNNLSLGQSLFGGQAANNVPMVPDMGSSLSPAQTAFVNSLSANPQSSSLQGVNYASLHTDPSGLNSPNGVSASLSEPLVNQR